MRSHPSNPVTLWQKPCKTSRRPASISRWSNAPAVSVPGAVPWLPRPAHSARRTQPSMGDAQAEAFMATPGSGSKLGRYI